LLKRITYILILDFRIYSNQGRSEGRRRGKQG